MQAHSSRTPDRLAGLGGRVFDLLVIGGGITGCGIARDAALRGLSVALVEKDDFASGTSSRSSRLIHGGVRYLEHGQLHLVFESSAERRRLLRLAPHLVRPLQFTWPVYEGARVPRWKLGAGLMLYDALALFRNVGRHRRLSRDAVLAREPMLRADGLRGGATYYDAATNDARLTLANAIGAAQAGAIMANHATMTGLMIESGHVVGATVRDSFGGPAFEVRARVVVNATGPWSDDIRALDAPASPAGGAKRAAVRGSKGAHIAVRRDRVRNVSALTLLSPRDGRVLFVLPDGARAIVGTTDDYTSSTPDQVRAGNEDVRYLLDAANAFFPSADLVESDVVSAWAGIRPLLPSGGDSPGAASREHAITTNDHGLISITGGKLTTYRVMAGDVVDEAARRLRRPVGACRTDVEHLPGGDFESFDAVSAEAWKYVAQDDIALHLASAFGTRAVDVAEEIRGTSAPWRLDENLPYTFGELHYSVRNELAFTLGDLLIRRTHLAFETSDHGTSVAPRVAKSIAPLLGWDAAAQGRAIDDYVAEVERIFGTQS